MSESVYASVSNELHGPVLPLRESLFLGVEQARHAYYDRPLENRSGGLTETDNGARTTDAMSGRIIFVIHMIKGSPHCFSVK